MQDTMGTIVTKEQYINLKSQFRADGKKVVLCHGVFDLVHPGHILHFQEAKEQGDILVVSITAARYVRKGPGRPYFDDDLRLKFLAAIEYIDYVLLSDGYTVKDIIETVEPDLYIKGQEYSKAEDDITGKIDEEVALVREHGGDVYYTNGQVFSSTKLINIALDGLTDEVKEYMKKFHENYSMDDIKKYVDKMEKLKVLVVGDVIIDEYIFCQIQGLMSKNVAYSARFKRKEDYYGGSVAVARHIASFAPDVTLTAVVGNEKEIQEKLNQGLQEEIDLQLFHTSEYPTIIKQRYVMENVKRDELDKVFVINNIPESMEIDRETMGKFEEHLRQQISAYDIVVLCDFGHGLITKSVQQIIEDNAKFLILNCQTNSTNQGRNLITKYKRANAFSVDNRELKGAFSDYQSDESELLDRLCKHLKCGGFHTKGAEGAEYRDLRGNTGKCPAFVLNICDTIGAGDAFFSIAGLCAAVQAPWDIGLFMGNIAGALAANIVGNKKALEKVNILKYANTLLNV